MYRRLTFAVNLCKYKFVTLIQILCSRFSRRGPVKVFEGYISFKSTLRKFCDENELHCAFVSDDYLRFLTLVTFGEVSEVAL